MDRREPWRYRDHVAVLLDYLTAEGVLTDPMWRTALQEVPRHQFVPDVAYAVAMFDRGSSRVIDRAADVTDWWSAIYTNCSIVTQRADGQAEVTDTTATPSCSLSCPSVAMRYLHLLDLDNHHRVLEVGTGTGWTAAMLAWRQGNRRVVTVEVDESLAKTAAVNLDTVGVEPYLVVGDGADGWATDVPYDRVHVTAGVRDIPHAWIAQTRPGGRIVAPWMPRPGGWGFQLVLDVLDEDTAVGRFVGGGGYMMMRSQRVVPARPGDEGDAAWSQTRMDPRLIADATDGALLFQSAKLPGVRVSADWEQIDGVWTYRLRLDDPISGSWATCRGPKDTGAYTVGQAGPRLLWGEAAAAHMAWLRAGSPRRDEFGMTVTPTGQILWLGSPSQVLS
jgi:protein-L-isoaspartate(D-aspartate) O-methyltransferase